MYYNGTGVAPDYNEVVRWYHKAEDQGHVTAQVMLGAMYSDG